MAHCYLCGATDHKQRSGAVRDNARAKIYECSCGLVFLDGCEPVDYRQGGMNAPDPAQWLKESAKDDKRRFEAVREQITGADVLDFGCGAGGFLLLAREVAEVAGVELEDRLFGHYDAHELDVRGDLDDFDGLKFDVITAFHVLEHLQDPRAELKRLKNALNPGGVLIIEVPSADDALLSIYGSEAFSRFTYWSCHRYLFNAHTLSELAKQAGLRVDYVKHIQRYPLSNHLYWLAAGEAGGHREWGFLDSPELSNAYESALARIGKTDTLMAGLQ